MAALSHVSPPAPRSRLPIRALLAAGLFASLSAALAFGGKPLGHAIALAGYSDRTVPREITIGGETVIVPENMIRHSRARRDGPASRLDLYVRWPTMEGFSEVARDDFNNKGKTPNILFIGIEPRAMSRDMSGRFEPIYRSLIESPGTPGLGDTVVYAFKTNSGYGSETLVAAGGGAEPFVARCLAGAAAEQALAPCERDIAVGGGLSLTYRFPRELLGQWRDLESAMHRFAGTLLGQRQTSAEVDVENGH